MKFLWIETLNIEKDTVAKKYRRDVKGKDKVSQGVNRIKTSRTILNKYLNKNEFLVG